MGITSDFFGKTVDGRAVERYVLQNDNGTSVAVLTRGATIQSIVFADVDIALGFDSVAAYEAQDAYIGATIGRFANRIGNGQFSLNGAAYHLRANNGPNHLHGGEHGFHQKIWTATIEGEVLRLHCHSPHGEGGYPGNLDTEVSFCLHENDELEIQYFARSDQDTVINLTNHTYFNLNGHDSGSLRAHTLQIFADRFTENDANCLPTGRLLAVEGTPMDFRERHTILERIDDAYEQLRLAKGYDHNWVIDGMGMRRFAIAVGEETGIMLEVLSDQPSMQLYTANFLELAVLGKGGVSYPARSGVCFETQGFPDAPNKKQFPTALLAADKCYRRSTVMKLSKK